jgi:phage/plasmid primase-like uncharacterized protein
LEIFRAAADAEKIRDFVIALEYKQQQSMQPEPVDVLPPLTTSPLENANAIDTSFGMATSVERAQSGADSFKPSERQYLAVPFAEKDFAKAAGALWDRRVKSWYVGPAADMNRLSRWMPGSVQSSSQAGVLPRDEFSEVLKSLGCIVSDGHPVMDGSKHRIQVEGDRSGEKAGFYVVHLDGHPAGYVKNNRTGQELRWKSKGYVLDPAQKAQLHADAIARTAARSAEIERLHEATAARLNSQLATLLPVQSPTPYLSTKGVSVHEGILTDKDGKTTCVPAYDVSGKLWSVQYIREDGTKRFAKDSRKEGCFHVVGGFKRLEAAPLIVIAEGYATAATLKQALRYPVVAAFDSGNLASVAMALHDRFANKPIVIAGDDDRHLMLTQGVNPGRSKAEVAAKQVGGHVVFPVFPAGLNGLAVDLSAINPQSYKEHERAAVELGLHDGGQLQGDSGRVQALKALLLPQQQLDAVAAMRRHTDFNDLAMSRSDGLAVVHRQLGAVLLQVQSEQRHFEQLAQQRQVRRERVG